MKKVLRAAAFILMLALIIGQPALQPLQAEAEDEIRIDMKVGFDKFIKLACCTGIF